MNLAVKPCWSKRGEYYGLWIHLEKSMKLSISPSVSITIFLCSWMEHVLHHDSSPRYHYYFEVCHLQVEHLVVNCSSSVALKSQSLTLCSEKLHVDASIFNYIYRLYNIGALISRWYTSFKKKWVAMVLEWPSHIHSMQHQSSAVLPVCNMRTQQRIYRYCIAFSWLNAWIHLEDRMTWASSHLALFS